MSLDPVLESALALPVAHPFVAVEILHPLKTIRLLDGLATLNIGGQVYVGFDPEIGSLAGIEFTEEGVGNEAPEATVRVNQATSVIGINLCVPSAQNAQVRIIWGAINPQTGLIVGAPYTYFVGTIDVATLVTGDDVSGGVSFDCISAFEPFFESRQGQRISHTFLQSISPGDLAFEYVTGIGAAMNWGKGGQRPVLTKASMIR